MKFTPAILIRQYFHALDGKEKSESMLRKYVRDEGLIRHVLELETAFPSHSIKAEDIISERDEVAVRARLKGIHQGIFEGIPPTGRPVELPFHIIYQVKDGKIDNYWISADRGSMLKQIGVVE